MKAFRSPLTRKEGRRRIVISNPVWLALVALAHASVPVLIEAQVEPKAGSWKTWVLTSGSQLRLPPPPGDTTTRAEIDQLKQMASQRDAKQMDRLSYWNSGPPGYRWTSMVVPAGQVSATRDNRNLSLLSVAIYDATIAAWDSKYAYGRPRPSTFDPTLQSAMPIPNSPSYPSEYAVVAGAASTVLSYLFPANADAYAAIANEQAQIFVQAGVTYPSDASAGFDLGRTIGAAVVALAKADGSDRPGTIDPPAGPCHWTGVNPAAPFFGMVSPWVLSSGSQLRPGPPPDCRSTEGMADFVQVRDFARTFDTNAAAMFWQSTRSSLVDVIDKKIFEYNLDANPPRAARVYAAATIAAMDATIACFDAKYTYWRIRPFMLGATTLFPTPNHPSYPAAHGCSSGAYGAALAYFFPRDADALNAMATEAGESRLWGGIHYQTDIDTGLSMGRAAAGLVIDRVKNDGADNSTVQQ
jgi:membrane-associated phospholipid phosphatase